MRYTCWTNRPCIEDMGIDRYCWNRSSLWRSETTEIFWVIDRPWFPGLEFQTNFRFSNILETKNTTWRVRFEIERLSLYELPTTQCITYFEKQFHNKSEIMRFSLSLRSIQQHYHIRLKDLVKISTCQLFWEPKASFSMLTNGWANFNVFDSNDNYRGVPT